MYRQMLKIFFKCLLVILPFAIFIPYLSFCQFNYMNGVFAMWKQQRDHTMTPGNLKETIILGDSRAKTAFIPSNLSDNTYNLALGGATSLEMYYSFVNYLKNHPKPKAVIIAFSPIQYLSLDSFWLRTAYYHYLSNEQFNEVFRIARKIDTDNAILIKDYQKEFLYYKYYLHNTYRRELKANLIVNQSEWNKTFYNKLVMSKGQYYFSKEGNPDGLNKDSEFDPFKVLKVIDYYLNSLIKLCEDNSIPVIIEQIPINKSSYNALKLEFIVNYENYLKELKKKHSNIIINTKLPYYENYYFADSSHLNSRGAVVYSKYIKNKYKNIF